MALPAVLRCVEWGRCGTIGSGTGEPMNFVALVALALGRALEIPRAQCGRIAVFYELVSAALGKR